MMKNLLWFARHPADEREEALLGRAYQRALVMAWCAMAIVSCVVAYTPGMISVEGMALTVEAMIGLSILAGWTAVREEEFEPLPAASRKPSAWWLMGVAVVAPAGAWAAVWLSDGYLFLVAWMIAFATMYIVWVVWTWKWLAPYTFIARLLGTVLWGPFVIGYHLRPKVPLWRRIVNSVGFTTLLCLPVMVAIVASFVAFLPVRVQSDRWAPEVSSGDWTLLNVSDKSYDVGDYVIVQLSQTPESEGLQVSMTFPSRTDELIPLTEDQSRVAEWRVGQVTEILEGKPVIHVDEPTSFVVGRTDVLGTLRTRILLSSWFPLFF